MPEELYALSADDARWLAQRKRQPSGGGPRETPNNRTHAGFLVRCGDLIEDDIYAGRLVRRKSAADPWEDIGTVDVNLGHLVPGTALEADRVYSADPAGLRDGVPIYWTGDGGGGATAGLYVHVRARTFVAASGGTPAHYEYTVRAVERSTASGGVTWVEASGASDITGVREDQNRLLYEDGTGGTVSQAYELFTGTNGYKWIEQDQDAGLVSGVTSGGSTSSPVYAGGLMTVTNQDFRGDKTLRGILKVMPSNASYVPATDGAVTLFANASTGTGDSAYVECSKPPGTAKLSATNQSMGILTLGNTSLYGGTPPGASGGSIWMASITLVGSFTPANEPTPGVPISPSFYGALRVAGATDLLGLGTGPLYPGYTGTVIVYDPNGINGTNFIFLTGILIGVTYF